MAFRYVPRYVLEQQKQMQMIHLSAHIQQLRFTEDSYQKLNLQYHILKENYQLTLKQKQTQQAQLIRIQQLASLQLSQCMKQKKKAQQEMREKQKQVYKAKKQRECCEQELRDAQEKMNSLERQKKRINEENRLNKCQRQILQNEQQKLRQCLVRLESQRKKKQIQLQKQGQKIRQTQKYIDILRKDGEKLKKRLGELSLDNSRLDNQNQGLYDKQKKLKNETKNKINQNNEIQQNYKAMTTQFQDFYHNLNNKKHQLALQKQDNQHISAKYNQLNVYYQQKIQTLNQLDAENTKLAHLNASIQIQNRQKYQLIKSLQSHIQNLIQMNSVLVKQMKNSRLQDYTVKTILNQKSKYINLYPKMDYIKQTPLKQIRLNQSRSRQSLNSKFAQSRSTMAGSRIKHQI